MYRYKKSRNNLRFKKFKKESEHLITPTAFEMLKAIPDLPGWLLLLLKCLYKEIAIGVLNPMLHSLL